jgi:type VI secretion system ImpM family protein
VNRAKLGPPGLLGKHASRGDFLNLGNREHAFTSFDAFLTHNLEWAEENAGARWAEVYGAGGVQAFVYRPTSGGRAAALVGALGPSSDRAGRRFPLSVAMPLFAPAELRASPEVLPLVLESAWQASCEFVLSLTADPDANVAEELGHLAAPAIELEEALDAYAEWTRSLPVDELWALIFGSERRVDPARVLALVSETVESCRGVEEPTTPLSLRLPLGLAGGAAVCFWLDWVRSIAHWKATVPSFFWSHDGQQGAMILNLGVPPRCTLAELWLPTGGRDEICDIATGARDLPSLEASAARWSSFREGCRRTLAELLHAAQTLDS